jgi:hypothetical protein
LKIWREASVRLRDWRTIRSLRVTPQRIKQRLRKAGVNRQGQPYRSLIRAMRLVSRADSAYPSDRMIVLRRNGVIGS